MQPDSQRCLWLLCTILGLRLLSMAILPLADTSEPRYAEIARLMAESGDWITPWFEPGNPFWGKPPLAFWTEALSLRLFGITEFAVRLPSWLATLSTLGLLFALARHWYSRPVAGLSVLILASSALTYVASGAVLTDPFLALGTTLSLVSFMLARQTTNRLWDYGFFIGLSIGLLAKGPLALVLTAGPLIPWLWLQRGPTASLRPLPWLSGSLLTLLISLPWYILAELKTPGFLDYFILGEHFLRFVEPGWSGDLYGSGHSQPFGTIWLHALMAFFPWGLIGLGLLSMHLYRMPNRRGVGKRWLQDPKLSFLAGWALFTPVFFTFSGNILWTYLLPALPGMALLLAQALIPDDPGSIRFAGAISTGTQSTEKLSTEALSPGLMGAFLSVPLAASVFAIALTLQPQFLKSEKGLIQAAAAIQPDARLVFLEQRPFSARFYSRETAEFARIEQIPALMAQTSGTLLLAVPRAQADAVISQLPYPAEKRFASRRFVLLAVPPESMGQRTAERPPAASSNTRITPDDA